MKNLLLNRVPRDGAWGGGNLFVKAVCSFAKKYGYNVVHDFKDNVDVIFLADPRPDENTYIGINEAILYKRKNPNVKIIHRVNECDARKGTNNIDEMLYKTSLYVDDTVFVSNWVKEYHNSKSSYAGGKHHVIYNGVDLEHFQPAHNRINDGRIHIVAHHWSNNRMKGFDVYEAVDDFVGSNKDFTFTYIGRQNGTFKNTNIVAPLFGKKLGEKLAANDVYISGSRWDPGPNHILESLACKIPTYVYSDGGGAVEFAGLSHIFNSIDELLLLLSSKKFKNNSFFPDTWESCVRKYFEQVIL